MKGCFDPSPPFTALHPIEVQRLWVAEIDIPTIVIFVVGIEFRPEEQTRRMESVKGSEGW